MITYCFDVDGTFYNLYAVKNWLEKLRANDPSPYTDGDAMVNMKTFNKWIQEQEEKGNRVHIITWLSKGADEAFNKKARLAKIKWIRANLPSLSIAAIHAVPYGTPKHKVLKERSRSMILIDDNEEVGAAWETPKQRKHVLPQDFFSSIGLVWDASAPQTT